MYSYSRVIVAIATVLLSGCAIVGFIQETPSVNPLERQLMIANEQAIVLVGIDSETPLGRAWKGKQEVYVLSTRKDIMAFPVNVGTRFNIDRIDTMDSRFALLRGEELSIERQGIYYFGTIKGTSDQVVIERGVSSYFLLGAKRKFGSRFDNLEAVNFAWPSPSDDRNIRFGYPISTSTQTVLRSYNRKRLQLASVAIGAASDSKCRAAGPLSLPEFLPYDEYIKRAFNAELEASQMYDDGPGSIALKGAITELSLSAQKGASFWQVGLQLKGPAGLSFTVALTEPFQYVSNGGRACAMAEDAFPKTVQKLIELAVQTKEFRALMSTPAAQQ